MNEFRYRDGKKDVSIEATFTNEVGQGAAQIFAMLRGGQAMQLNKPSPRALKAVPGQEDLFEAANIISDETETTQSAPIPLPTQSTHNPAKAYLHSLFEQRDDEWILVNPSIKAKSKNDFVRRVVCLFLQFQLDNGIKLVSRNDCKKLLENCSVYDGNARDWFAREKLLIRGTASDASLLLPGKEYVNEILVELLDDNVTSSWKIGTPSRAGRKPSSKKKKAAQTDDSTKEDY